VAAYNWLFYAQFAHLEWEPPSDACGPTCGSAAQWRAEKMPTLKVVLFREARERVPNVTLLDVPGRLLDVFMVHYRAAVTA